MNRRGSLPGILLVTLLSGTYISAQSWSVKSITGEGDSTNDAYDGFPYSLHQYPYDITSFNSRICSLPDACWPSHKSKNTYACSIGINETFNSISHYTGNFEAPSSLYSDFQNHTVGKILTRGFNA